MTARSIFRAGVWVVIALALLVHVGLGWHYSNRIIDDGFTPDPNPMVVPVGGRELVEVTYESDLGTMEAWYLPASGDTWVIHVHGRTETPAQAEFLFDQLSTAGYPQLSIAYRNDEGQPSDPSGLYQFGATEWADIKGAMDYAQANGADQVVFSGFGTGSSHILSYVYRHNLDSVVGLMMDSPDINHGDTVSFNAGQTDMPVIPMTVWPTITGVAKFITSLRIEVNWKALDYIDKAPASLRTPVLIHHGSEDETVPISQSLELAESAPDLVRMVPVEGAGHIGSYDADSDKYVDSVLSFLQELG